MVLIVDNDHVRLESAGDLWGRTNREAQQAIRER